MSDMSADYGMCFTGESAALIESGDKWQTRRVLKAGNSLIDGFRSRKPLGFPLKELWGLLDWEHAYVDDGPSPAGNTGQYLHVPFPKEGTVHRIYPDYPREGDVFYVKQKWFSNGMWRSARYMPRCAATIFCRVTRVRVERLIALSEEDAYAEGVREGFGPSSRCQIVFSIMWDKINQGHPWRSNPWVIVREFERVKS